MITSQTTMWLCCPWQQHCIYHELRDFLIIVNWKSISERVRIWNKHLCIWIQASSMSIRSECAACMSIDSSHSWLTSCIPSPTNSAHLGGALLLHLIAHAKCVHNEQSSDLPFIHPSCCVLWIVCISPSWAEHTALWANWPCQCHVSVPEVAIQGHLTPRFTRIYYSLSLWTDEGVLWCF